MHDIDHGYSTSRSQIDISYGASPKAPTAATQAPKTTPRGYGAIAGDTRFIKRTEKEREIEKETQTATETVLGIGVDLEILNVIEEIGCDRCR